MAFGGPYRAILARPGAAQFSISGLISRFPMSMVGIGIVLMIQGLYGSYELAGRVSAVYVLSQAVCGPQIARLIDRHGQARVMRPLLAVSASGITLLMIAAVAIAPSWALYVIAALAGSTIGSMGTLVRARWTLLLDDPHDMHTAYSLEAALDELVFVLGPVLATWLATSVTPWAGLVFPIVTMLVGGYWFLSLKDTEPTPVPQTRAERPPSVLRFGAMIMLVLVFVALGGVFGAGDVATIAFAESLGQKSSAGIVLAVFAAGSFVSGLWYGSRRWVAPLWARFTVTMLALAAGVSLFPLVNSLVALAAVMFVTGLTIAPSLIGGNGLVQLIVPPAQLTEGLTYVGTALGVGVSFGSSIAGSRIDAAGPHAGFMVAIVCAGTGALLVLASMRILKRSSARQVPDGAA
jgi:predicted MFS family arabinose efflux permease